MSFDALYTLEEILSYIQFGMLTVVTLLTLRAVYRNRGVRLLILLGGAYACFLMGDLFLAFHYMIIGEWPYIFSAADISYIGLYCFLIAVSLEHSGDWTEEQRQAAKQYRQAALIAPAVVILSLIMCIVFYPDILFNCILYSLPLSFLGYYSLLSFFVARKTREEKPSMYFYYIAVLLFLSVELGMFMVSSYMYTEIHYLIYHILSFLIYVPMVMLLPLLRKGARI